MLETRSDKFEDIEKLVKRLHSYEAPIILSTDIDEINQGAANWIDENLN